MKKLLVVSLAAACGSSSGTTPPPAPETIVLPSTDTCVCIAMGVDYANKVGTTNAIGLPSGTVGKDDLLHGSASGDPTVRAFGDRVFVLNRFGYDSITELTRTGDTFTYTAQFSTGAGSNPQDIAVDGDTAYVAALGTPSILVFDLAQDPPVQTGTIDLSSLQDDGNPDAVSILLGKDDKKLYVSLDLLDSTFTPAGLGVVAVVDPLTKAIGTQIKLNYRDPYGFMMATKDGKKALIPTLDDFSGVTGCLERVDLGGAQADPCVASNADLGGTIGGFALDANDKNWLAVTSFATGPETGKLLGVGQNGSIDVTPISGSAEVVTDVASCGMLLLYSDAASGALHVFDLSAGSEGATVTMSLPPGNQNDIACFPRTP